MRVTWLLHHPGLIQVYLPPRDSPLSTILHPTMNPMSILSKEDEALYDRQIRLWGRDSQQKIRNSKVIVAGYMTGVAHELIKNVVLKGVGQVILITWEEYLPANFDTKSFLFPITTNSNIKVAENITTQAINLNPTVIIEHYHLENVSSLESIILNDKFSFLALINETKLERAFLVDRLCRESQIAFEWILTRGMDAILVNDFGKIEFVREVKKVVENETISESFVETMEFNSLEIIWEVHKQSVPPLGKPRKALPLKYSEEFSSIQDQLEQEHFTPSDEAAVNSIFGAIAAQESIKIITGKDRPLENVVIFNGRTLDSTILSLSK